MRITTPPHARATERIAGRGFGGAEGRPQGVTAGTRIVRTCARGGYAPMEAHRPDPSHGVHKGAVR